MKEEKDNWSTVNNEQLKNWTKSFRNGTREAIPNDEEANRWLRGIYGELTAIRRWVVFFGILMILSLIGFVISLLSAAGGF